MIPQSDLAQLQRCISNAVWWGLLKFFVVLFLISLAFTLFLYMGGAFKSLVINGDRPATQIHLGGG